VIALLAIVMMTTIVMAPQVQADSDPLYVSIEGDIIMGKGETKMYRVDVAGGPSEGVGNYTYTASIIGTTAADATVTPTTGSSEGPFFLNVTSKGEIPRISLYVNVTSSYEGEVETKFQEYAIQVVDPIYISAKVVNTGNISVSKVPLTIYGDGKVIHNTTVSLDPREEQTVRYNWTDPTLAKGEHVVKVVLDPDQEYITFLGGGTVHTSTIWLGEEDWGFWNIIFIVLAAFIGFVAYNFYRRPSKRRKR
jgi:hypothetical protein